MHHNLQPKVTVHHQHYMFMYLKWLLATEKAWQTPFVGSIHKSMLGVINRTKRDVGRSTHMVIVQSSGTGKSRAVHELAQLVFTVPFNLRADHETTSGTWIPMA
jgi:hypothetical protein